MRVLQINIMIMTCLMVSFSACSKEEGDDGSNEPTASSGGDPQKSKSRKKSGEHSDNIAVPMKEIFIRTDRIAYQSSSRILLVMPESFTKDDFANGYYLHNGIVPKDQLGLTNTFGTLFREFSMQDNLVLIPISPLAIKRRASNNFTVITNSPEPRMAVTELILVADFSHFDFVSSWTKSSASGSDISLSGWLSPFQSPKGNFSSNQNVSLINGFLPILTY